MMQKLIITLTIIAMLFTSMPAFAATGDTPSAWAKPEVQRGIELEIVPARLQSKYQDAITREEFAELIVNAVFANVKSQGYTYWTKEQVLEQVTLDVEFEDAKQEHVKLAYILGAVNGVSDTKFAPDNKITRQEAAMMLVNTSHISVGFSYADNKSMGYKDFNSIAEWAKPAVQAAWSIGFMQGNGDKFNPKGNITREQAIATVLRLYERPYTFALRGNLTVSANYHEFKYNIGKDYITVNFEDDGEHTALDINSIRMWNNTEITRAMDLEIIDIKTAATTFLFTGVLIVTSTGKALVEPTSKGKHTKWDYGYMTVEINGKEGILKFEYKPITGYMTQINGYKYGYPFTPVTVNPLEI